MSTRTFIQWKGTDLCMDLECECGAHNHYDGYFAYWVECGSCGKTYRMPQHVDVVESPPEGWAPDPLRGTCDR